MTDGTGGLRFARPALFLALAFAAGAENALPTNVNGVAGQDIFWTRVSDTQITGSLTKKERLIILMYYYEGLTMREIGEIMELTESRVCQIHSNVMARLKAQLDRVQSNGN